MNNEIPTTLEQVQNHFRNAQKVKCLFNGQEFDFANMDEKGIHAFRNQYWVTTNKPNFNSGVYVSFLLFDGGNFAQITEYKKLKP